MVVEERYEGDLKIGKSEQLGDVAASIERINDAMTKQRALLDSAHQVGLFASQIEI